MSALERTASQCGGHFPACNHGEGFIACYACIERRKAGPIFCRDLDRCGGPGCMDDNQPTSEASSSEREMAPATEGPAEVLTTRAPVPARGALLSAGSVAGQYWCVGCTTWVPNAWPCVHLTGGSDANSPSAVDENAPSSPRPDDA